MRGRASPTSPAGCDLLAATDLHRLLQVLLGLPEPVYHHHRLITDDSRPQARQERRRHLAARAARAGWTPADVRRAAGLVANPRVGSSRLMQLRHR